MPQPKKRNRAYEAISLLQSGDVYLAEDLAHELGVHYKIAERHLRELWVLDLIYISGWDRLHHHWVPRYRWGNRADAKKPAALTPTERHKRQYAQRVARRTENAA